MVSACKTPISVWRKLHVRLDLVEGNLFLELACMGREGDSGDLGCS